MMVVDFAAFTGAWPTHPVNGRLDTVLDSLTRVGVDRILVSPLDAVWCRNPHLYNGSLYQACAADERLLPVPVIDPSISTWRDELREAGDSNAQVIRLLPNYHGYDLVEQDALWDAVSSAGLVVIVQTRMEDPRRQHPMAVVEDVPAKVVADLADQRRDVRFVIGGARTGEIHGLRVELLERKNLFADVSQADGLDAVRILVGEGLMDKLLFGSHAPLLIPDAAMARVVTDLEDEVVEKILGGNAEKLISVSNVK